MRITGGIARGIPLTSGKSQTVRPAMDRTREAVFSSLATLVVDATFIDLFAGVGAYGLEALSRGASSGLFVEMDFRTLDALKVNLEAVHKSIGQANPHTRILKRDVLRFESDQTFDLIFLDPPYSLMRTHSTRIFEIAAKFLNLGANSRLIVEIPGDLSLPPTRLECLKRIGKGNNEPTVAIMGQR